jgi:hypothetical protein
MVLTVKSFYFKSHTDSNKHYGQHAEFLDVKIGGTYGNYCVMEGQSVSEK